MILGQFKWTFLPSFHNFKNNFFSYRLFIDFSAQLNGTFTFDSISADDVGELAMIAVDLLPEGVVRVVPFARVHSSSWEALVDVSLALFSTLPG